MLGAKETFGNIEPTAAQRLFHVNKDNNKQYGNTAPSDSGFG